MSVQVDDCFATTIVSSGCFDTEDCEVCVNYVAEAERMMHQFTRTMEPITPKAHGCCDDSLGQLLQSAQFDSQ